MTTALHSARVHAAASWEPRPGGDNNNRSARCRPKKRPLTKKRGITGTGAFQTSVACSSIISSGPREKCVCRCVRASSPHKRKTRQKPRASCFHAAGSKLCVRRCNNMIKAPVAAGLAGLCFFFFFSRGNRAGFLRCAQLRYVLYMVYREGGGRKKSEEAARIGREAMMCKFDMRIRAPDV